MGRLAQGRGRERVGTTHLVQVHDAHSDFAQTFAPVDIGLGRSSDTTTTEL
jgi:hypothetical protein